MKWTSTGSEYFILDCSSRDFYANGQIIGIDPDGSVYYGADGGIGDRHEFSAAEREELADYMIAQWQAFKASDTTDALEATCCGRTFRAHDDRLTYVPFGELDFVILPGRIYALAPERDTLRIETLAGAFRLCNVAGSPEQEWCIVAE